MVTIQVLLAARLMVFSFSMKVNSPLAFSQRHKRSCNRTNVFCIGPYQAISVHLFQDVSRPPGTTAQGKSRREQITMQAKRNHHRCVIILNICIQALFWLQLLEQSQSELFHGTGNGEPGGIDDSRQLAQYLGTWISCFVY